MKFTGELGKHLIRLAVFAYLAAAAGGLRAQLVEEGPSELDTTVFWYANTEIGAARTRGPVVTSWEGFGWIGTDRDRLWWRTFGELSDGGLREGELSALYGRYVRTFWDVVAGARYELEPIGTAFFVAGIQGLAPYWLEVALLASISNDRSLGARFELEADYFLTQRLVTRPALRVDWSARDDVGRRVERGFSTGEVGLRTRYEIRRKFAPYLDVRRVWESGADEAERWRLGAGLLLIW